MKNFDIISIPVAPHVKKFMLKSFGEIYELTKNDHLGIFIIAMLSKKFTELNPDIKLERQSEYYQVSISMNYFLKEGFSLDFAQKKLMGKAIDLYMRDMVYTHAVLNTTIFGHDNKQGVINFCEALDIATDDIDPETLCRDLRRKKSADAPNLISNLAQFQPKKSSVSV